MTNHLPELTINLSDPDDVRTHLPAAQRVAEELRDQAQQLLERAEAWDRVVAALEAMAGGPVTLALVEAGEPNRSEGWHEARAETWEEPESESWDESEDRERGLPWPAVDGLFVAQQ